MIPRWRCWFWKLGLASWLAMGGVKAFSGDCALAQSAHDGTLGAESSVVTPNVNINGLLSDRIDGGAIRGANLFHSFREFNVKAGQGTYFANPSGIENILSRVTGGSRSDILGKLGVLGNANLFLINPNGIIFGPNASLDVKGSFVATTANAIGFGNQGFFSASDPNVPPLLTVNPSAFLFNQIAAQPITINARRYIGVGPDGKSALYEGLKVPDGQSLLLLGGNVSLDRGILQALGGRVELGGLADAGNVGLSMNGSQARLSFPDGVTRADVYLTNSSSNSNSVNIAASNGGSLAITARNIDLSGDSQLRGGIAPNMGFPGAQAGDIELSATGAIAIDNGFIRNKVEKGAVGNAGDINIKTGSLDVRNGAQLNASTRGKGDAGIVTIHARDTVSFDGVDSKGRPSAAYSNVEEIKEAEGNGGGVNITTGSLSLTNGAQLSASTRGKGNAGSVNIHAGSKVSIDNGFIRNKVEDGAVGSSGDINITARSIDVRNGALLNTSTRGNRDAGSVKIKARDTVTFDGGGAFSTVESRAEGNGGGVNITTGSLSVMNGAQLTTNTAGRGNAGSVNIHAGSTVSFDGVGSIGSNRSNPSKASSAVEVGAVGNGGNINITTGSLSVTNGGGLTASNRAQKGDAGNVTINARDTVTFDGVGKYISGASSALESGGAERKSGNINITTGSLSVTNGAGLTAKSKGSGAAGNIEVKASSIRLDNQGNITATTKSGNGGNITLQAQNLLLLGRSSRISTTAGTAQTLGNGGNITIDTDNLVALKNSDISANAFEGKGGDVKINTQGLFLSPDSQITASSEQGINGVVEINRSDIDPSQGLATLPAELVEASGLIATGCSALGENEFIVTGRGGLPPNPTDMLSPDTVWTDLRPLTKLAENRPSAAVATQPTSPTAVPLVEAQGWVINDKGVVVLTATASTTPLGSEILFLLLPQLTCHDSPDSVHSE